MSSANYITGQDIGDYYISRGWSSGPYSLITPTDDIHEIMWTWKGKPKKQAHYIYLVTKMPAASTEIWRAMIKIAVTNKWTPIFAVVDDYDSGKDATNMKFKLYNAITHELITI